MKKNTKIEEMISQRVIIVPHSTGYTSYEI